MHEAYERSSRRIVAADPGAAAGSSAGGVYAHTGSRAEISPEIVSGREIFCEAAVDAGEVFGLTIEIVSRANVREVKCEAVERGAAAEERREEERPAYHWHMFASTCFEQ